MTEGEGSDDMKFEHDFPLGCTVEWDIWVSSDRARRTTRAGVVTSYGDGYLVVDVPDQFDRRQVSCVAHIKARRIGDPCDHPARSAFFAQTYGRVTRYCRDCGDYQEVSA